MKEGSILYRLIFKIVFRLLAIAYCTFHFFNGNYGYISYRNSDKNFLQKKDYYENQVKKNEKTKTKISRLSKNNLDLELLEENIKKNTPIVKKNEIVIFLKDFKQ
jgi:cell division protein FtsB